MRSTPEETSRRPRTRNRRSPTMPRCSGAMHLRSCAMLLLEKRWNAPPCGEVDANAHEHEVGSAVEPRVGAPVRYLAHDDLLAIATARDVGDAVVEVDPASLVFACLSPGGLATGRPRAAVRLPRRCTARRNEQDSGGMKKLSLYGTLSAKAASRLVNP